ncbi:MAG: flagellar export chaperone FliS [bacterium]
MDDQLGTYRTMETHGKSQLDLILQVYNGAIKAYETASAKLANQEFDAGREELEKAKRFVVHLYTTLDTEQGGEVADNLSQLYAFVVNESNVVAATKDTGRIDDIVSILDNLRQGWQELRQQVQAEPSLSAPAPALGGFTTSG